MINPHMYLGPIVGVFWVFGDPNFLVNVGVTPLLANEAEVPFRSLELTPGTLFFLFGSLSDASELFIFDVVHKKFL